MQQKQSESKTQFIIYTLNTIKTGCNTEKEKTQNIEYINLRESVKCKGVNITKEKTTQYNI